MLPPVIIGGVVEQRLFVLDQLFVEQAPAIECMFAQHALAPAVDGKNRCFVHRFGSQHQAVRCHLAFAMPGVGCEDSVKVIVGLDACAIAVDTAEVRGGIDQPLAYAVRQFAGGGTGKGHDQYLRRL